MIELVKGFTKEPEGFYVYTHHRLTNNDIFYVGKGKKKRYSQRSRSNRNPHWTKVAKKHGVICYIIQDGLSEDAALQLERELILQHGRQDIKTGVLVNFCAGGEGTMVFSAETLKKISDSKIGELNPMYGKRISEQQKEAIRKAATGRVPSLESRLKMSIASKGKIIGERQRELSRIHQTGKKHSDETKRKIGEASRFTSIKGVCCIEINKMFLSLSFAAEWLRNNEYPKAAVANISAVCLGKRPKAYGYTWAFTDDLDSNTKETNE